MAPQLRYRVLTSAKILKDVDAALARWVPEHEVDETVLGASVRVYQFAWTLNPTKRSRHI